MLIPMTPLRSRQEQLGFGFFQISKLKSEVCQTNKTQNKPKKKKKRFSLNKNQFLVRVLKKLELGKSKEYI